MIQQHCWRLIRNFTNIEEEEITQIKKQIDFVFKTNVDYLVGNMGTTEFTPTNATKNLIWMNETTKYIHEKYHRKSFYITNHISTGQNIFEFNDPWTGKPPINFNFISYYAGKLVL
jgi:hypothetical protein